MASSGNTAPTSTPSTDQDDAESKYFHPKVDRFFFLQGLIKDKQHIVDVGCGNGQMALKLAERFPNVHVTGVDNSPDFVQYWFCHEEQCKNLRFVCCEAEDLPFGENSTPYAL